MRKSIKLGIKFLVCSDPIMADIINKYGSCNLKPSKTYFRNLVSSIISQQLSSKAANTIYNRFLEKINNHLSPENILQLSPEEFRSAGISKQKMSYLIALSNTFMEDREFFNKLNKHSDDEIIKELTKIKGIGLWTAQMFLIFSLNRLNVFPVDDVGIRNSIKLHYKLRKEPDKKRLIAISNKWGEYKSIASWYLWKALDDK